MKPILVGIDYSMRSPGVCIFDPNVSREFSFRNCQVFYMTEEPKEVYQGKNIKGILVPSYKSQEERFENLSNLVLDLFDGRALIAIENYAYSKGVTGQSFDIGENTGVLKHKLYKRGNLFTLIEPSFVKKYATSWGDASKKEMLDYFDKEDREGSLIIQDVFPANLRKKVKSKIVEKTLKNGQLRVRDKGTVPSPISDIIDAYYICRYLYLR